MLQARPRTCQIRNNHVRLLRCPCGLLTNVPPSPTTPPAPDPPWLSRSLVLLTHAVSPSFCSTVAQTIMADNNEEILEDLQNDDLENADEEGEAAPEDAVRAPFTPACTPIPSPSPLHFAVRTPPSGLPLIIDRLLLLDSQT